MRAPISFEKRYVYQPLPDSDPSADEGKDSQNGSVAVYRALDKQLDRVVCVKQVNVPGKDERTKKANLEKAISEVRLLAKAGEMNLRIPAIYDFYIDARGGVLYIFMELIKGGTLREHMKEPKRVLSYMIDLCDILHELDRIHIHHKDIKPENLMISQKGELWLIDFNISGSLPNMEEGTRFYKAPEMGAGTHHADRSRSDMFSIGVILYEAFTGELPREGIFYTADAFDSKQEKWKKFREAIEVGPDVPPAVNEIITKCMSRQPRDRYRNYGDLKRALERADRQMRKTGKA